MCDITNSNFMEKYANILSDIASSDYIAVDCEFSGLLRHYKNKLSLFDTPAEIYEKIRRGAEEFVSLQIGISAFKYDGNEKYNAITYTFYLFPRFTADDDYVFACDPGSIHFLCEQKFDFNKVFHSGLTYVKSVDVTSLVKNIENGSIIPKLKAEISTADKQVMCQVQSEMEHWNKGAKIGDSKIIQCDVQPLTMWLITDVIETQCPDVNVYRINWKQIKVEKVGSNKIRNTEKKNEELLILVMGFTSVIREVIAMKKPVVGHNMIMDLIMIYKMFIGKLPVNYNTFKTEMLKVFPEMYDTKCLSYYMKALVLDYPFARDFWSVSTLQGLYDFFTNGKGTLLVISMPYIVYGTGGQNVENDRCQRYHDSGYDSYCTGYVFLKLAHMFSMWSETEHNFVTFCPGNGPNRYFSSIKKFKNCVYLSHGKCTYMCFDNVDPVNRSQKIILVEARKGSLNIAMIKDVVARFDAADVKPLTKRKALIGSINEKISKSIQKQLGHDKNLIFKDYNKVLSSKKKNRTYMIIGIFGIAVLLGIYSHKFQHNLF